MAEILAKKVWRVKDIVRREGTEELVSVLKVNHPFRHQRLIVIPVPRYAKEEYFKDWIYQPYVKEHHMYVSNDIYNPFYVFYCRYLLTRNRFPDYAYFHPMGFPDCIDLNMTRRAFLKREQPFKTPNLYILFTSTRFRDKHHPWVARRTVKLVGDQYVTHPREGMESMVLMLPPEFVPEALNALQGLGFQVEDTTTVPIGDPDTLKHLNSWSHKGQMLALLYIWFLIFLFILGEARHVQIMFNEYMREMVIKAGKDPEKMGL